MHDIGDVREGRRTPIDVVMEHGGMDFAAACAWLGERLGVHPESAPEFSESSLALRFAGGTVTSCATSTPGVGGFVGTAGGGISRRRGGSSTSRNAYVVKQRTSFANVEQEPTAIACAKTAAGVVTLARVDRRLVATDEQWDADPWMLNTPVAWSTSARGNAAGRGRRLHDQDDGGRSG